MIFLKHKIFEYHYLRLPTVSNAFHDKQNYTDDNILTYTLKYLTEDSDIIHICNLYWKTNEDGEFTHSVKEIAALTSVTVSSITRTVKESCHAYVANTNCDCCSLGLVVHTRNDVATKPRGSSAKQFGFDSVCRLCFKQLRAEAEAAREVYETEQQIALLQKVCSQFSTPHYSTASVSDLSLKEALVLHTTMLTGSDDNYEQIQPLEEFSQTTFPDNTMGAEALQLLRQKQLIYIDVHSSLRSFELDEQDSLSYYPLKVSHIPTFAPDIESISAFLGEINWRFDEGQWAKDWFMQVEELFLWIAEAELRSLLRHALQTRNLPFVYGEKTKQAMLQLLKHFSIGQAYSFIYRAAVNAVDYRARTGIYGKRASNSIAGNISRNVDRALAENWTIKAYNRPSSQLPETLLSTFFSRKLLKLGPEWFDMKLMEIIVQATNFYIE